MPNRDSISRRLETRRALWYSIAAVLLGLISGFAGLLLQGIAWACENDGCPGDLAVFLFKLVTVLGFVALWLGAIGLLFQIVLRFNDPRYHGRNH